MFTKNKSIIILFSLLIFTLAISSSALALTAEDIAKANQEGNRIQRERTLQQQKDAEQLLRSRRPATHLEVTPPPAPKGKGEGCRAIQTVKITGAKHMPADKKADLVKSYSNRCLGVNEIQSLMGEITAYYIDKGYSTTRAYLPQQDLTTGTLTIEVIEGTVGKIRLKDGDKGSLFILGAFPRVLGNVLNLRDIEQGLDQINRLASNNATMDIKPGEKTGESVIVINNTPSKRWHLNTSADNYGTRTTGRNQIGVAASFDNLLNMNEFYSFNQKKTVPFNDRNTQSTSGGAMFSLPLGYFTVTASYADSNYDSQLNTPSALVVHMNGNSHSWYGTLDRLIYRDKNTKLNVSATMTAKETNNYVEGVRLAVSSRSLSILDFSVTGSTTLGGGVANFGAGYSRGLKNLGAQKDLSGLASSTPRAQFDKLTASGSYYYPFQYKKHDLSFNTAVTAQYAFDTLYGSEQFSIGGIYSVRGFYEESLANDDGLLVRNDLSLKKTLPVFAGRTVMLKPYVAMDAGTVGSFNAKTPTGILVGGAIGISLTMDKVSFDLYAGHPLIAPKDMAEGFNSFGRLSVNF